MFTNILEYVESHQGLRQTLYPVQRFILKLAFAIPLDNVENTIRFPVRNWRRFHAVTEQGYLQYLFNEGRCNVREQPEIPPRTVALCGGRRIGKTLLSNWISSFIAEQLLELNNPQGMLYGINCLNPLYVGIVALNGEQFEFSRGFLQRVSESVAELQNFKVKDLVNGVAFKTSCLRDLDTSNLRLIATSNPLRGRGIRFHSLILDELAYMNNEAQTLQNFQVINSTGENISVREHDRHASRTFMLSTPRETTGSFYRIFSDLMRGTSALALRIPSWEGSPRMWDYCDVSQRPGANRTEYAAEFSQGPRRIPVRVRIS